MDIVEFTNWFVPRVIGAGGVLLLIAVVVALSFGRDSQGWTWASGGLLEDLMPWRWPRIMAALFAGVMLAVAGCIIQRLTGNPMASPSDSIHFRMAYSARLFDFFIVFPSLKDL